MNINVASIGASRLGSVNNLFRLWLEFTKPLHNLTPRQVDLLAYILNDRYRLILLYGDADYVDKYLLSTEHRKEIRNAFKISENHLNVMINSYKVKDILSNDNKLNPKYVPCITDNDSNLFQLVINFNLYD